MLQNNSFSLSDFDTFDKPTNFEYMNDLLNKFALLHFIYHFCAVCLISLSNLILIERCRNENVKRELTEICGMVGRMWLPFNYDWYPPKQIIFIYQVCMNFLFYWFITQYNSPSGTGEIGTEFKYFGYNDFKNVFFSVAALVFEINLGTS